MPENLHFHIHDAFAPFPEEHQGIYDIVHVRFMVLVVMDTERGAGARQSDSTIEYAVPSPEKHKL
jgi:hypothetical protein